MAKSHYSIVLNHSAEEVWAVIRPFDHYAWAGVQSETTIEAGKAGDQVGAIRRITMGEKTIDWMAQQSTGSYIPPRNAAMSLAFLGSDAASCVNGHDLVADGGFNAAMLTGQIDFSGVS